MSNVKLYTRVLFLVQKYLAHINNPDFDELWLKDCNIFQVLEVRLEIKSYFDRSETHPRFACELRIIFQISEWFRDDISNITFFSSCAHFEIGDTLELQTIQNCTMQKSF